MSDGAANAHALDRAPGVSVRVPRMREGAATCQLEETALGAMVTAPPVTTDGAAIAHVEGTAAGMSVLAPRATFGAAIAQELADRRRREVRVLRIAGAAVLQLEEIAPA
jgi:hypothetical protein